VNAAATVSAALNKGAAKRLPRWVNNVLVIVIGFTLAFMTVKAMPAFLPQTTNTQGTSSGRTAPIGSGNNAPDLRQLASSIADQHIFGDFSAPKVEAKPVKRQQTVSETRLNIKLAGVFAYTPEENAMAILSVDNGDQEAFHVGAKVVGETTLEEVHPNYVIINNRGKLEKVLLSEDIKPLANTQIRRDVPTRTNANNGAGQDPNAPVELPSSNPGELRDFLARNPAMLGRVVAAEPYQENGKLLGYRITPKQNPEILEAQGIVAGDVITRVNNIQINSQKQGVRALRNVVKANQLDIVVLRDGVEVPLSISLTQ